jgi:alanyl-tRNA synthetase
VRRIEAVTGSGALLWIDENQRLLGEVAEMLRSTSAQVPSKVEQLLKRSKKLEKELASTKQKLLTGGDIVIEDIVEVDGVKILSARIDGADAKTLRDAVDRYKDKLQTAVVVLGSVDDGKVRLAAGVTHNTTDRIKAGDVIKPVAEQVGGRGGGRPDFAQAGGSNPDALDKALASVSDWVSERLI